MWCARSVREGPVNFLTTNNLVNPSTVLLTADPVPINIYISLIWSLQKPTGKSQSLKLSMTWPRLLAVSEKQLLTKVQSRELTYLPFSWIIFCSFGPSQVVSINGILSSPHSLTSSVIHGIVLGPLLFLLHINGIFRAARHVTPFLLDDGITWVYSFEPSLLSKTITTQRI